ncbi:MAG: type II secretion system protein, partial [Fibrobacter sp.]|nr:type II secretion system protein [Fibrobacter sp.]
MKKGFTLMELVVYMAIMGIIVLVAGQAFSNSTKFRVRTQNMIRATQE